MPELRELSLPGVFALKGDVFRDDRGDFRKLVHREVFSENGLEWQFAEQYVTGSKRDVVRGMHLQLPPFDHAKLVSCVRGEVLDVLVDLRRGPGYGKTLGVPLGERENLSLYIPRGVAHGFRSLSDDALMLYNVTSVHEPKADSGVRWDSINFDWQIANPTVSARDRGLTRFSDFESPF